MSDLARRFYQDLRDDIARLAAKLMPWRATVVSGGAGPITIQRIGQGAPDGEAYARLSGFDLPAGSDVILLDIEGKPVALGELLRVAPADRRLSVPLKLLGGADLIGYADAGATQQRWSINGAGAAIFGSVNTPVWTAGSQDSANTASTTSTTTYSDAMSLTLALPAGTWEVLAFAWLKLRHSEASQANMQILVDGQAGAVRTQSVVSSGWEECWTHGVYPGIAGGRTITAKVQFKSGATGTTTADMPGLILVARRTA